MLGLVDVRETALPGGGVAAPVMCVAPPVVGLALVAEAATAVIVVAAGVLVEVGAARVIVAGVARAIGAPAAAGAHVMTAAASPRLRVSPHMSRTVVLRCGAGMKRHIGLLITRPLHFL